MKRRHAYLGLTLAVVFWGTSFVATKVALHELAPAAIVFVRFGIGLMVLAGAVGLRRGLRSIRREELPMLVVLGFVGITLHQWLQATGLETTTATATAWIVATIPVFVALLGWGILGERLGWHRIAGIAVAACGAATVVSGGKPLALIAGQAGTVGDLLVAASALNWAIFTILSKHLLHDKHSGGGAITRYPVTMMLYVMGFGWVLSLPWLAVDGAWRTLTRVDGEVFGALVFLGVAASGLAYLFWYGALGVVDATEAGAFLYLEPLVTVVVAALVLGEQPTAAMALGGMAILLGVWLVGASPAPSCLEKSPKEEAETPWTI